MEYKGHTEMMKGGGRGGEGQLVSYGHEIVGDGMGKGAVVRLVLSLGPNNTQYTAHAPQETAVKEG